MRMLVPTIKCDGCGDSLDADTRITSIDFTPSVGKVRHFEGDLCTACDEELYNLVEKISGLVKEFRAKQGRPPKDQFSTKRAHEVQSAVDDFSDIPESEWSTMSSSRSLPDRYRECLVCHKVEPTRQALSGHTRKEHGAAITTAARRIPTRLELQALRERK